MPLLLTSRPACGERSDRIVRCDPGEGETPQIQLLDSLRGGSPQPSPRKGGEKEEERAQFVFTSGQPPLSSGRKASSPGTVAISL
jgi:hypothetical protein